MGDAIKHGGWKTATIDYSVDDDLSNEVDLGHDFTHVLVLIPTIDSAAVSIHVTKDSSTFFPVHDFIDADGDATVLQASTAGTGGIAVIFKIGSARFIKIATGAAQTADRTIYCKGVDL